jgi:hypothetical protein
VVDDARAARRDAIADRHARRRHVDGRGEAAVVVGEARVRRVVGADVEVEVRIDEREAGWRLHHGRVGRVPQRRTGLRPCCQRRDLVVAQAHVLAQRGRCGAGQKRRHDPVGRLLRDGRGERLRSLRGPVEAEGPDAALAVAAGAARRQDWLHLAVVGRSLGDGAVGPVVGSIIAAALVAVIAGSRR